MKAKSKGKPKTKDATTDPQCRCPRCKRLGNWETEILLYHCYHCGNWWKGK